MIVEMIYNTGLPLFLDIEQVALARIERDNFNRPCQVNVLFIGADKENTFNFSDEDRAKEFYKAILNAKKGEKS